MGISTEIVPDKVLTIEFEDGGGIISYVKDDGKFIHTLNTKEGFRRKSDQLKIGIKDSERCWFNHANGSTPKPAFLVSSNLPLIFQQ